MGNLDRRPSMPCPHRARKAGAKSAVTESDENAIMPDRKSFFLPAWIFCLAFATRAWVAVFSPDLRGDWAVYQLVARNILRGCGVSLSPLEGLDCIPHFGGNGLPGYPAFIAMVWGLTGTQSTTLLLLVQAMVAAAAIAYLCYVLVRLTNDALSGASVGVLMAFSLPEIYWARNGLAETLTCAAITCALAELLRSKAEGRLRILPLAALISAGVFLRLDFVFLLPAIAIGCIGAVGWKQGIRKGVLMACMVCVPIGVWTARNVTVGLPSLMPPAIALGWLLPDGSQGPLGYLAWIKTWIKSEQERADAMYLWVADYNRIKVPDRVLQGPDGARAADLLLKMRAYSGQQLPSALDEEFRQLAAERHASMTLGDKLLLFASQVDALWQRWYNPFLKDGAATVLSPTAAYQTVVAASFLVVLLLLLSGKVSAPIGLIALMAGIFAVSKSLGSVPGMFIENRYTVTMLPLVESAIGLAAAQVWRTRVGRTVGQKLKTH